MSLWRSIGVLRIVAGGDSGGVGGSFWYLFWRLTALLTGVIVEGLILFGDVIIRGRIWGFGFSLFSRRLLTISLNMA
jgi:hypothetical protein